MKILKDSEYRKLIHDREMLMFTIDHVLKQFRHLDRNKPIDEDMNKFYFWDSIGWLKGAMMGRGAEKQEDWIEPGT